MAKIGRPRKTDETRKDIRYKFRMTDRDRDMLRELGDAYGISDAEVLRRLIQKSYYEMIEYVNSRLMKG